MQFGKAKFTAVIVLRVVLLPFKHANVQDGLYLITQIFQIGSTLSIVQFYDLSSKSLRRACELRKAEMHSIRKGGE